MRCGFVRCCRMRRTANRPDPKRAVPPRESHSIESMTYPSNHPWSRRRFLQAGAMAAGPAFAQSVAGMHSRHHILILRFLGSQMLQRRLGSRNLSSMGQRERCLTSSNRWVAAALSSITTTTAGWISSSSAAVFSRVSRPGSGNRLYRNNRDGTFSDVTAQSGLNDPGLGQRRVRGRLQQ